MKHQLLTNLIAWKSEVETKPIWDIEIPATNREWFLLSTCNNLDLDFIRKYHDKLSLEQIIVNGNLEFREQVAKEFNNSIDWTSVALLSSYKFNSLPEDKLSKEKLLTYELIKDNEKSIDWNKLCERRHFSSVDNNFLREFYNKLDWSKLIGNVREHIDKDIIESADKEGFIDWTQISKNSVYPKDFIKDNHKHIVWEEYLKKNPFWTIPIECQCRDNIMIAIMHNPDILNLIADKNLYASASDYLKHKVWIDRVPDDETHFADDSSIREEHLLEHKWVDRVSDGNTHFDDEQEYKEEHVPTDDEFADEHNNDNSEEEFEL